MKFQNYLTQITNISIYPVISLVLFFTIFCFVVYQALKMSQRKENYIAHLPLDDNSKNEKK